jgi:hypothetical protein
VDQGTYLEIMFFFSLLIYFIKFMSSLFFWLYRKNYQISVEICVLAALMKIRLWLLGLLMSMAELIYTY